jgi:glutaminyl-tRNA synthetase
VDHRPLYDWAIEQAGTPSRPRQYEFARLSLNDTVMSKRKLLQLVEQRHVRGWDDPRLPTVSGFRRRGYTPESIRDFCARVGVARKDSVIDVGLLEHCVREDLTRRARRAMAVLRPLKLVLTNCVIRSVPPHFRPLAWRFEHQSTRGSPRTTPR